LHFLFINFQRISFFFFDFRFLNIFIFFINIILFRDIFNFFFLLDIRFEKFFVGFFDCFRWFYNIFRNFYFFIALLFLLSLFFPRNVLFFCWFYGPCSVNYV
jgi:hypothetical protein